MFNWWIEKGKNYKSRVLHWTNASRWMSNNHWKCFLLYSIFLWQYRQEWTQYTAFFMWSNMYNKKSFNSFNSFNNLNLLTLSVFFFSILLTGYWSSRVKNLFFFFFFQFYKTVCIIKKSAQFLSRFRSCFSVSCFHSSIWTCICQRFFDT